MSIVLDLNVFQKIVVLMIVAKYNANLLAIVSFANIMASVRMNTKKWDEGVKFSERVGVIKQAEIVRAEICTSCLLCGESVPMSDLRENPIKICDDCKQLWKELKEKRSDNNAE